MDTSKQLLFVYGTLRKGSNHAMQRVLAQQSQYIGEGRIDADLFDLGNYPGIVLGLIGYRQALGDLRALNPGEEMEILALLDEYEGCAPHDPEPHEYRRQRIRVTTPNGENVEAWAYVLQTLPSTAVPIPGGDFLAWRQMQSKWTKAASAS